MRLTDALREIKYAHRGIGQLGRSKTTSIDTLDIGIEKGQRAKTVADCVVSTRWPRSEPLKKQAVDAHFCDVPTLSGRTIANRWPTSQQGPGIWTRGGQLIACSKRLLTVRSRQVKGSTLTEEYHPSTYQKRRRPCSMTNGDLIFNLLSARLARPHLRRSTSTSIMQPRLEGALRQEVRRGLIRQMGRHPRWPAVTPGIHAFCGDAYLRRFDRAS